ncbi:MAG: hypothetical protein JXA18_16350, partial [Chitinispirillaceae bacterium]|nr:hypothetical protein [Chitinispirillaceae bacterium]
CGILPSVSVSIVSPVRATGPRSIRHATRAMAGAVFTIPVSFAGKKAAIAVYDCKGRLVGKTITEKGTFTFTTPGRSSGIHILTLRPEQ